MKAKFYADIFLSYSLQNLKTRLAYRGNFFFGVFGIIIYSVVNIGFLWAIFSNIDGLKGWRFEEVLFIYGMGQFVFGIFSVFFLNFAHKLPKHYIVDGHLDRPLLRPLSPYFQLILENLNFNDLMIILKGMIIMMYCFHLLQLKWHLLTLAEILLFGLSGALVYAGVWVTTASLSFWFKNMSGFFIALYTLNHYSRFPITIYPFWIRFIFTWILPLAFVAFFPSAYFLPDKGFNTTALFVPLIGCLVFGISLMVWNAGLKKYESTGT
ncbi:MAG: ABC-2 family transporter protein [Deltaproteobacteria bacterium]|nr:ABC-2 family transporter protein [Deltaproteobacteria bacterium]